MSNDEIKAKKPNHDKAREITILAFTLLMGYIIQIQKTSTVMSVCTDYYFTWYASMSEIHLQ